MAIIQCPECGNAISDQISICPHCNRQSKTGNVVVTVVKVLALVMAFALSFGTIFLSFFIYRLFPFAFSGIVEFVNGWGVEWWHFCLGVGLLVAFITDNIKSNFILNAEKGSFLLVLLISMLGVGLAILAVAIVYRLFTPY